MDGNYVSRSTWPLLMVAQQTEDCEECLQQADEFGSVKNTGVDPSLCTEQCIVVTCDQIDHISDHAEALDATADVCANTGCDESCTQASYSGIKSWPCDLPGCTLEELLQCCGDDKMVACPSSYPQLQSPTDQQWTRWQPENPLLMPREGATQHQPTPESQYEHSFLHMPTYTSPSTLPLSMGSIQCMWADCGLVFTNQAELLSHIQCDHLQVVSNITIPPLIHQASRNVAFHTQPLIPAGYGLDSQHSADIINKILECRWDDCMTSIPTAGHACVDCSPSASHIHPWDADVLFDHLLKQHLNFSGPQDVLRGQTQNMEVDSGSSHPPSIPSSPSKDDISISTSCQIEATTCGWVGCNLSFATCDELTEHITEAHVGHGKSSYECFWGGCDRHGACSFPSKQKVLRHIQKHTGYKPHTCSVCNERFAEATSLQQHMRRHTRERPYVCDFPGCGKSFSIPGGLRIHKRAHSGEKPFKCPEPGCDRAFAESSNLAKHLRIHTGIKPFRCTHPECGKSFGRKDQLLRHVATHQSIKEERRSVEP
ncbi:zinc-finger protein [Serendipita sp. 401]|nr:zinc-finger protein [Serendipita sp. 401]KAG9056873.1 zinc-finger protein [Serendipita sp. 407]